MANEQLRKNFIDVVIVMCSLALLWFALSTDQVTAVSLGNMMQAPSMDHVLGTDNLGRDLAQRLGSVFINAVIPLWLCVLIASALGIGIAILHVAGTLWRPYKQLNLLIQSLISLAASVPVGIAAFVAAAHFGQAGLQPVFWTLLGFFTIRMFLMTVNLYARDQGLAYWQAHESLGGTLTHRLWFYGVTAHWKHELWDQTRFHMGACIAIEAAISYLGFGIQEPHASFGNMLASHFDSYLHGQWVQLIIIVISMTFLSLLPTAAERLIKEWGLKKLLIQHSGSQP